MKIDNELILRLEELARIELDPEDRARTAKDLQEILSYMDTLSAVDTADVPVDGLPGELTNVLRADVMRPSPGPDALTAGAPDSKEGQFKAPKTFD